MLVVVCSAALMGSVSANLEGGLASVADILLQPRRGGGGGGGGAVTAAWVDFGECPPPNCGSARRPSAGARARVGVGASRCGAAPHLLGFYSVLLLCQVWGPLERAEGMPTKAMVEVARSATTCAAERKLEVLAKRALSQSNQTAVKSQKIVDHDETTKGRIDVNARFTHASRWGNE